MLSSFIRRTSEVLPASVRHIHSLSMRVIIDLLPFIVHIKRNCCLFPSTTVNLGPNSKLACKEVSGKQLGKEANEVKGTPMMG